jgi:acylphosphatase
MPDGSVHIIAEGSLAALEEFARLMWARGVPEIRVDCVQVTQGEATGEFKGFWVKW